MTCAQMLCLLAMGSLIGFAFHPNNTTPSRMLAMVLLAVALSTTLILLEMAR